MSGNVEIDHSNARTPDRGGELILQGVVGSTAYGLAREGSDVDRLGVFVAPTLEVAGLAWNTHRESTVTSNPDVTRHEVGKYLRLALKCNPTILELMWLPGEHIEIEHPVHGTGLTTLRQAVLSEECVRSSYGGYARQQATRLRNRGDGSFSAETRKRTTKHARHLFRLLRQGHQLLTEGQLDVKVANPQDYWAFDTMTTDQMLETYEHEDKTFMAAESVLPASPDVDRVRRYLNSVRTAYLTSGDHS
ncbi:MAG: DNA polymerase beta superfamily protein [Micromonosporaceae bacterium]